jgi:hypothetical protein
MDYYEKRGMTEELKEALKDPNSEICKLLNELLED